MISWRIARADVHRAWREAGPAARAAAIALAVLVAIAVAAPLGGYAPGHDVNPAAAGAGPSAAHWLGTDHLGRDVAWRLALGARAFVLPGALAAAVAMVCGTIAGAASGWFGGTTAIAVRWATGVVASMPRLVWVLLVCAAWGDAPARLGTVVGLAYAPALAEAIHARLDSLRRSEYLLATEAHGVPGWRRLWVHGLIAGCGRLIARHGLLCFAAFLVVETTLSYIGGFGVAEPQPSWGNMLAFEWGWSNAAIAPALAVWSAVAGCTLAADALQDSAHG